MTSRLGRLRCTHIRLEAKILAQAGWNVFESDEHASRVNVVSPSCNGRFEPIFQAGVRDEERAIPRYAVVIWPEKERTVVIRGKRRGRCSKN